MRTKVTLVLLFLNAALFFFIFRFERPWQTERAALEVRRRVLGAEASDIRFIEVARAGGAVAYRLERRGDDWYLTQPMEWPANPQAVSRMISDLQFLEDETSFRAADLEKNGQSLADYGLDHPGLTVTFGSGQGDEGRAATTTILKIGDPTQVGNRLYLLSPDGARIHVVGREIADCFSLPPEQIRIDSLVTIPVFEARSLTLQTSGAAGVRVSIRRDGNRWQFETPILSRANRDAIELAINELGALRVGSFVSANPPSPAPSESPILSARIEGNNRSETLIVGEPAPSGGYYAQLKEGDELRPVVFTVKIPTELLSVLRDAPEELRERRILDFDPAAVTAVTLAAPDAPNQPELLLQRLEAPVGAEEARWQVARRNTGHEPQPIAADAAAVQRLLARLAELSAESFQSDDAQAADLENWGFNQPEREIGLTLASPAAPKEQSAAAAPIVLQIGRSTPRGPVYARILSAPSVVYSVNAEVLDETQVAARAWRDRLLRDLPGASVVSLTLTDLASGATLYSRALEGSETWEKALENQAPARRDALLEVIARLRTLRARSFVADQFADRVSAGGEDRPWRYRLDATLSLPGGGAGEQKRPSSLWLTERIGGTEQYAGSPEFGAIFAVEQPFIDSLWILTYGSRDPGAPPEGGAARNGASSQR